MEFPERRLTCTVQEEVIEPPTRRPAGSERHVSIRRWGRRIFAKLRPFRQTIVASDALLRSAIISGDEPMVLEMLHPELVPHCLGWSRTGPANLERRYPDDHENGFDGQALDYICQGLLLRHGLRPTPRLRRRAAASARRRAVLLRRLLGDSIHGCALRRQLEETFHLILPPEPGDPLDMISLMAPTAFHRCAALGGAEVLQTLSTALAWRPWLVLRGCDAPEQDDDFLDSMPAEPLLRCQQRCLQDGYGGFVVRGSQAYFRRRPASGLLHSCIAKPGDVLHIAPGPTCGLPRQSLAALLLGQTDGHRAAMDLALESGDEQAIVELGKLGCKSMMDRTADAAILDRILYGGMPQWLARAVGNLAYAGKLADDCGTALQDAQQIRGRVLEDVEQVQQATGTSTAVAEALLRHFGHSPEAAISQFQVDAKAAKTAAGIREGPTSSELVCGICFAGLEPGGDSLRRLLPCEGSHAFCDACLRQYLEGLLASGNVRGMVCPEPECRLPLGEACIEGILGSAARQKFVRLAALQAVDAAAHICWCPQPGCEKAVARTGGLTVRCACGYTFCSSCKLPGGHEPCTCEQIAEWKAVHGDFVGAQEQRQRQQDRAESWVRRNAQHCPGCRAIVQRNGGCNHMVCRCGTHFCYVCDRPWDEHTSQEGGIDYYVCRMPKADRNSHALDNTMVQQFEDPVAEFQMLERSEAWARRWAEDAYQLCQAVQYSEAAAFATPREDTKPTEQMLSVFLKDAVETLISAQATLRFCCIFRWDAARRHLQTGPLEFWLGELAKCSNTLQAALGPTFERTWNLHTNVPTASTTRWTTLETTGDLRAAACRLDVLQTRLDDLRRLRDAVRRLRGRVLAGAREGAYYGAPPGLLEQMGRKLLTWLGF